MISRTKNCNRSAQHRSFMSQIFVLFVLSITIALMSRASAEEHLNAQRYAGTSADGGIVSFDISPDGKIIEAFEIEFQCGDESVTARFGARFESPERANEVRRLLADRLSKKERQSRNHCCIPAYDWHTIIDNNYMEMLFRQVDSGSFDIHAYGYGFSTFDFSGGIFADKAEGTIGFKSHARGPGGNEHRRCEFQKRSWKANLVR